MRRLFLDSNVVLDFILNRAPFAETAEELLDAVQGQQIELLVASLTFVTSHYVVSKALGKPNATEALKRLFSRIMVVAIDAPAIAQALQAPAPDFEDAVQLYAALAAGADAIVTRDPGASGAARCRCSTRWRRCGRYSPGATRTG